MLSIAKKNSEILTANHFSSFEKSTLIHPFRAFRPLSASLDIKKLNWNLIVSVAVSLPIALFILTKKVACLGILALTKQITGNAIEELILPAIWVYKAKIGDKLRQEKRVIFADEDAWCSPLSVKTDDGILLDAAIVWSNEGDYKAHCRKDESVFRRSKWVVFFNGNATCYEKNFLAAKLYSDATGCNILMFNYRGVMDSQGYPRSAKELVDDGKAIIRYLLDNGVASEDILIDGVSLGGSIGTYVRAIYPDGPIANEQSFSSLDSLVEGIIYKSILERASILIRNKTAFYQSSWQQAFLAQFIARTIAYFAKVILEEANWQLDSASKWKDIKGYKWIVSVHNDDLIWKKGSLYWAAKQQLDGYAKVDKQDPEQQHQLQLNNKLKSSLNHIKVYGIKHGAKLPPSDEAKHLDHVTAALKLPKPVDNRKPVDSSR